MSRSRRVFASVLLSAALLSTAPAFAGGREPAQMAGEIRGVFSSLWQALSGLLPTFDAGRAGMDPDGAPTSDSGVTSPTSSSESETDGRAGMDPNG